MDIYEKRREFMHIALAGACGSHESGKKKNDTVNSSPFPAIEIENAHDNKIISHKISRIFYVFGIDHFHVRHCQLYGYVRYGELSLR